MAGAALAPMSLGWPIGSIIGGRLILRLGYRPSAIAGLGFIVVGVAALNMFLSPSAPLVVTGAVMALVGLGMGFSSLAFLLAVQSSVSGSSRGVATASVQFFRTIGGAIGVAAIGALLTAGMPPYLATLSSSAGTTSGQRAGASVLLDPSSRGHLPIQTLNELAGALNGSLHSVYVLILVAAVAGLITASRFPAGMRVTWSRSQRPPGGLRRHRTRDARRHTI